MTNIVETQCLTFLDGCKNLVDFDNLPNAGQLVGAKFKLDSVLVYHHASDLYFLISVVHAGENKKRIYRTSNPWLGGVMTNKISNDFDTCKLTLKSRITLDDELVFEVVPYDDD